MHPGRSEWEFESITCDSECPRQRSQGTAWAEPALPEMITTSRHSATPPSSPASFGTMVTLGGSAKLIFLALPPPK